MAIIKAVSSRASIANAINYITKDEKTEERLISGIECSPETAIEEMKATKAVWNKTDGRQYKHFVQSFPPDEMITPQQAHKIAQELCAERFKGYEVIIATHKDKDHVHSHIIVNSVSYDTGRKIQNSGKDLQDMKNQSDELCMERGLSIAKKGEEITAYKKNKYKVLEKAVTGDYKSYVLDCYKAATVAIQMAISREDFIEKMKEAGWETAWTDRKYITFADMDGNKVRNSNLEKTFKEPFGKEDLQHGFENNIERANAHRIAEQSGGLTADKGLDREDGASTANDTDIAIEKLNATIRDAKDAVSIDDRAKGDRIAEDQSRQRKQNGIAKPKTIERSYPSQGHER